MHLAGEEHVVKVYRHHLTPFVFLLFKLVIVFLPFSVLIFVFQEAISQALYYVIFVIFFFVFVFVVGYISLIYWLDRVILTNKRIVHINWRVITLRDESEVVLTEIEDIKTQEKGILAYFRIFDYGTISLYTASSDISLDFMNAPDPEGMRKDIFEVRGRLKDFNND